MSYFIGFSAEPNWFRIDINVSCKFEKDKSDWNSAN